MSQSSPVPPALRIWFIIHFVMDMLFAIPLFFSPTHVLSLFGWTTIDPLAARLVASAFFAIGSSSFLVRNASPEVYRAMLDLKLIWSAIAMIGILISLWLGAPRFALAAFVIFLVFFLVWAFYRKRLSRTS